MTRRRLSPKSRHIRAVRALGGVRAAKRAEQLRACGLGRDRVAERLGVTAAALDDYYALQDDLASTASPGEPPALKHSAPQRDASRVGTRSVPRRPHAVEPAQLSRARRKEAS
jgi:hypothetical protein